MDITNAAAKTAYDLSNFFKRKTRDDGRPYFALSEEKKPAWLTVETSDFSHEFHQAIDGKDCRLPSDWVYELAKDCCDLLVNHFDCAETKDNGETVEDLRDYLNDQSFEIADPMVPCYEQELLEWAGDHYNNRALIDEACQEFGAPEYQDHETATGNFVKSIQIGYLHAIQLMLNHFAEIIFDRVEELETEE